LGIVFAAKAVFIRCRLALVAVLITVYVVTGGITMESPSTVVAS
jgi:hypothetical protein